jgi:hypothetical protein
LPVRYGITLLNYNDILEKPVHIHPHFVRVVANLEEELDDVELPWGNVMSCLPRHYFTTSLNPKSHFPTPDGC